MTGTDYLAGDDRTNRERMLAGDYYVADDPELSRRWMKAVGLCDAYQRAFVAGEANAHAILTELVGDLGKGAFVKPPLSVDYIGAGSVVTKDIPANTVAVGNPAKVIRKIQGDHD